jgi:hypothetical protein
VASKVKAELAERNFNPLILALLYNNIYLALGEDGSMIYSCQWPAGDYHMDGDLVVSPYSLLNAACLCPWGWSWRW